MKFMEVESMEQGIDGFRSPMRKLVRFFRRSRDGWKAKYKAKRQECRAMENQARAVEKSRDEWRERARNAQAEVRRLEQELEQYKNLAS